MELERDGWSARITARGQKRQLDRERQTEHAQPEARLALRDHQQLQAEYARAQARAEQQEAQAQALYAFSQSFSVTQDLDDLRQGIVDALYDALRADTTSLFRQEDDGRLRMVAQRNIDITRARIVFGPDEGLIALAMREERVVHVPDTAANAHYLATGYDRPRSLLAIPAYPQAGPSYAICIVRRRISAFTDDEVQFATIMANVAAQALGNADLYHQMQRMANEQGILHTIAQSASFSDGVTGFIGRTLPDLRAALQASGCVVAFLHGRFTEGNPPEPQIDGALSPFGKTRLTTFMAELSEQPAAASVALRCIASPEGARMILAPIVVRGEGMAIVGWEFPRPQPGESSSPLEDDPAALQWSDTTPLPMGDHSVPPVPLQPDEAAFIANVAQHLALGIENLHLRARDLSVLGRLHALPASRPHLDQLQRDIVREVERAFAPTSVALVMRDSRDGTPRLAAATPDAPRTWLQAALALAEGARDRPFLQRRNVVLAALVADERLEPGDHFHTSASLTTNIGERPNTDVTDDTTVDTLPILGWLVMRIPGNTRLAADRVMLFTSLAAAAALVLHNARLHLMTREAVVDRERQRIAREIHDGVAQNLAHLMLRLELIARLIPTNPDRAAVEALASREVLFASLNDLRQSIAAMAPAQLDRLGFTGAVRAIQDDIATNTPDLAVHFTACPDDAIPPELRAPAYRIVQEALTNIRKHAQAHHAWVSVEIAKGPVLRIIVRDDGQGFDPTATTTGHFGLSGMRERAIESGGELAIASVPGQGTIITVTLPF